ncbi:hypothetical protein DCM91_10685 [Chitinophaga costaii]|nr:hypothetical protein DCM91_10685 [Chitinophaga costaii]
MIVTPYFVIKLAKGSLAGKPATRLKFHCSYLIQHLPFLPDFQFNNFLTPARATFFNWHQHCIGGWAAEVTISRHGPAFLHGRL